jgi:hypothetical protein
MPGWLAGLALAGASIFVFPGIGDSIREPKWVWLWGFALAGIFLLGKNRRRPPVPPLALPLLAYFLIQPYFHSPAKWVWPFTLCLSALVVLGAPAIRQEGRFKQCLYIAAWLQLGLGVLQLLNLDPIFSRYGTPGEHPLSGFIGQQTLFGAWMAALGWFCFANGQRALFVACSVAAFLTGAAFTAFAWVAGLCAYLLWRRPKLGLIVSGLGLVVAWLGFLSRQGFFWDNYRLRAWRMIVSAWLQRPWFGYGVDNFAREFPYQQGFAGPPWQQAHSEPLELLFGGGVVGVLLALLALLPLWFRRAEWWGKQEYLPWFLALTVILANSLGNFPLHIAPLALLAAMAYFRLASRVAV